MRHLAPVVLPVLASLMTANALAQDVDLSELADDLNSTRSVAGSSESKSYEGLFDAFLGLEPPPVAVGVDFNHLLIHPGMDDWSAVSGWAESNPAMADAIRAAQSKTLFGLPYGLDATPERYRDADLVAEFAVDGSLNDSRYPYLRAVDTIAAFSCAESYRLLEAGQHREGIELAIANIFVLRQCCDREFLSEQLYSITLLSEALSILRDMFYVYRDDIPMDMFAEVSMERLPYLRPDRSRLFMPEGDRLVSEALIRSVFRGDGQPEVDEFAETFSAIQSETEPFTRFGAVRRWRMIAEIHDSLDSTLDRLGLVYDDWWRRWRVQEYDPILAIPTQFDRTNPIRFAAVIYSLQDIDDLFTARDVLIAQTWGTAVAAGVAGYHRSLGAWPRQLQSTYSVSMRKSSNRDPFDPQFGPYKYEITDSSHTMQTAWGTLTVDPGTALLWSKGQNRTDERGREHTDDGVQGDIVLWPPVRALLRESGMMN